MKIHSYCTHKSDNVYGLQCILKTLLKVQQLTDE